MPTIGSLFAGIGGFDLGFERVGFRTVWQCEIDKAAQGVLRRRFPAAALHSDVREVGAHNLEPVDVVTFGSPCQDLSVAGKRAGLAGGRSGLFHEAARIIRELRQRYGKPDFAIWENVPGAFSSNDGRDFAAVVQAMVDLGARDVCWRVLDSRYFGVAQRRRRVFLVADFGGERAEQILFESESLRGNPAKGRKARKVFAASSGAGVEGSGEYTGTLTAAYHKGTGNSGSVEREYVAVVQPIAFNTTQITSPYNYSSPKAGDPCHPLAAGAHPPAVAYQPIAFHPTQTPISSTDGVSHAMSNGSKGGTATVAVCARESGPGYWMADDVSGTLRAEGENRPSRPSNVVVCATGEATHTLTATSMGATEDGAGRGCPVVAQAQAFDRYNQVLTGSVTHPLRCGPKSSGMGDETPAVFSPAMQVRRLTPTEAEALQGFPRNWTSEGTTEDGKIKQQADGPRYKQLGNAVTVNVAEWIARRVRAVMEE